MFPIFTGGTLQRETVAYVLVAAAAHLGTDLQGHFQAAMKTRPIVQQTGQPMHWLLTNDDVPAQPVWNVPDWFCRCSSVFWLLRADCVNLHTYQAVQPQTESMLLDETPAFAPAVDDPQQSAMPETESHFGPADVSQAPDATTAAIMALLQTTTVAERQRRDSVEH